jgi:hypothetical protein
MATSEKDLKKRNIDLLFHHVTRGKELLVIRGLGAGLSPEQHRLSHWQTQRLLATYPDLAGNPRYGLAVEFFLEDLYGPKDFSKRDYGAARLTTIMAKVLPAHSIHTAALAMELNALSHELDHHLLRVLIEELDMQDHITAEAYAEAYRRCDNYNKRKRQIELIRQIGDDIEITVARHSRSIITALRLTRMPSHLVGLGELHDFLERGFIAFRQMEGADVFLNTIVARETQLLDRIYAGHPQPFDLDLAAANPRDDA